MDRSQKQNGVGAAGVAGSDHRSHAGTATGPAAASKACRRAAVGRIGHWQGRVKRGCSQCPEGERSGGGRACGGAAERSRFARLGRCAGLLPARALFRPMPAASPLGDKRGDVDLGDGSLPGAAWVSCGSLYRQRRSADTIAPRTQCRRAQLPPSAAAGNRTGAWAGGRGPRADFRLRRLADPPAQNTHGRTRGHREQSQSHRRRASWLVALRRWWSRAARMGRRHR